MRQSSIVGLVAVGMTFVMITAGIDLSVGSIVGLSGMAAAMLAPSEGSALLVPIVVALAVGTACGYLSSVLIVWGAILPFLATLAMMAIARSAALVLTDGQVESGLSDPFENLGSGSIGPIPIPVAIFLLIALVADFVLSKTKFGYHVYAIGGNEESAPRSASRRAASSLPSTSSPGSVPRSPASS